MDEFVRELKESAAGLHDGMGGHADYCALLMEKAASFIAEYQETFTAKDLALKAAKAMQQAETERADANERDAKRYRYIRDHKRLVLENDYGEVKIISTFRSSDEFDYIVDRAMKEM